MSIAATDITKPTIVGPQDGKARLPGQHRRPLHGRRRSPAAGASRWSNTRCRRARWPRRCTVTRARTSTATCSRGAWGRCSATTSSRPGPATSSSSPATSGTPSGTPAMSPCRILEIISPGGFEQFFEELDALGGALEARPEALAALNERYGLEMRPETVPGAARVLRPAPRRAPLVDRVRVRGAGAARARAGGGYSPPCQRAGRRSANARMPSRMSSEANEARRSSISSCSMSSGSSASAASSAAITRLLPVCESGALPASSPASSSAGRLELRPAPRRG